MKESDAKTQILDRLKKIPLMTRSMMSVVLTKHRSKQLTEAINELVAEGVIRQDTCIQYRRTTPLYYLASEAENLKPYLGDRK